MRRVWIVLLLGCATPPDPPKVEPNHRELRLAELEAQSLQVSSFRALYELRDESTGQGQILEIAWRSPHDAKLVSSSTNQTLIFTNGVCRIVSPSYRYEIPYLEEFRALQERYAGMIRIADELTGVGAGRAPQLAFDFNGTRPQLTYTTVQTRFLWMRRLRDPSWSWDGKNTFRTDARAGRPAAEIELDDRGFLVRMRLLPEGSRGFTMELKSVSFEALADEVFAAPASEAPDVTAQRIEKLRSTIADGLLRSILGALRDDLPPERVLELFAAWYRVDLERTYDPKRAVELVREGQSKWVADAKAKGMSRDELRSKLELQKATALGQVEIMEEQLWASYRPMMAGLSPKLVEISEAGLAAVVERELRAHVRAIFDGYLKELEQ